ncbi:MAG: CBS protein [uncultured bacterium]|nr:MAG: CBS protein [uncultured bacterium]HBH19153.1 CBS domain-containing protein [Cyanobacteria bacterium UBA9579]
MKCRDVMTKYIKMCRPECTAKDAVQIMQELNCGAVPVINENNEIQGMVTDRDIALYTILNNKDPETTQVKEFMSKPVVTCHPDDDIDIAIKKMKENKVRRLPIVDENNKVVGIISLGDIAVLSGEEHEVYEALENISEPVSSIK